MGIPELSSTDQSEQFANPNPGEGDILLSGSTFKLDCRCQPLVASSVVHRVGEKVTLLATQQEGYNCRSWQL